MKISFIVNHVFDGWSPLSTRLGGSEECVVEWSKRLAKDHKVQVFHNGQHGKYDNVKYRDHSEYEPGNITINVNYPELPPKGKTIYFTSLDKNPNLDMFDAVCVISEYAKNHTGVMHENVHIIPPGYDETKLFPEKKIPKQCLYASSPDRGLDVLLDAWPKVYESHPDATLLVTYGATPNMPGVIGLGEVGEDMMNELYRTSDIWCHPCTGVELYCMVGKKAQISGCIPVIIPAMALTETVERGFKTDIDGYAQSLIEVLSIPLEMRDVIRKDIINHANATTWQDSTNLLLKVIHSVVE